MKTVFDYKPETPLVLEEVMQEDLVLKLLEFGIAKGSEIQMKSSMRSGDPVIISGANTNILLRKKEAKLLFVKPVK
jgi:Fe2+ transport system protein FeoA